MRRVGLWVTVLGVVALFAAGVWWYLFFEPLLGDEVQRARECFYYTSDVCAVGNMVGEMAADVPRYHPAGAWVAGALMALGVVLMALLPGRATRH